MEIWANLAKAKAHQEPAHGVRAVMGAYAVLEQSIRTAQPQEPGDEKKTGERAWESFTKQTRLGARSSNHDARALSALFQVRNNQPISHGDGAVQALDVMGDVEGRMCVLIDDMIDTAGTICAAAEILLGKGATEVWAMCTHPVLSEPATDRRPRRFLTDGRLLTIETEHFTGIWGSTAMKSPVLTRRSKKVP